MRPPVGKGGTQLSEALSGDEVRRIVDAVGGGMAGARDRAFLTILYRCGLRANECRMLDLDDVHRESNPWSIRVRFPKGIESGRGKPRELGVDSKTREIVSAWIRARGSAPGPLFVTRRGERVDTSHYRRKIKRLARAAGISRRVHPHALRHAFARGLNDEGVSMRLIQLSLGHSNLNTTAIYLESLGDPEVISATSEREW